MDELYCSKKFSWAYFWWKWVLKLNSWSRFNEWRPAMRPSMIWITKFQNMRCEHQLQWKIIAFGPVFMFLSLWNDTCTIFSYFEHLRVCGEARKISRNSKNRWFLELRFKRSLTASKWDMNIFFLITERYNVKFVKFTWKNMDGRMAGRYMNHESRYTPIFM